LGFARSTTVLAASKNQIQDRGAVALAEALKTNRSLISLDLVMNDIGDEGCLAFAEGN
jgi:hypothetical protein